MQQTQSVVVVTGAASGLGAATARLYASRGAQVFLGDIDVAGGRAVAGEIGGTFVETDVCREEDVRRLIDTAAAQGGRLDTVISNAGVLGVRGSITELDIEGWNRTMAVHITSVFLGMKHAARHMIPQRSGAILATSSTAGVAAMGPHCYSAMKTAVIGLVRSVAAEMAEYGITVNCVAPGMVATGLTGAIWGDATSERSREVSPLGRAIEPADIAEAFWYLGTPAARNVTGQVLVVDAGTTTVRGPSVFNRLVQEEAA